MANNHASRRVMQKLGMRFLGIYDEWDFPGKEKTAVVYKLWNNPLQARSDRDK